MLVGATAIGRDLGPRVSARVQTGLTADCKFLKSVISIKSNPRKRTETQSVINDSSSIRWKYDRNNRLPDNRPQMATVRPGVMQKIDPIIERAKTEVIEYNPGFIPDNKYVEIWISLNLLQIQ